MPAENDHTNDPGVKKYHEPTFIGDGPGDNESAEPPREASDLPFEEAVEKQEQEQEQIHQPDV